MDILVTYDIADTEGAGAKRLRRVADVCTGYGVRVQFSVFECRLSPSRYERLITELLDVIDTHIDSVRIYRFDGGITAHTKTLGRHEGRILGDPWII